MAGVSPSRLDRSPMAHDVFISHSSSDAQVALAIVSALEAQGIRCWVAPRDIQGGQIWAEAIMQGIGGARAMVVVFSSHANRSSHVLTEVDAAVRRGAIVVPFRIEAVMPEGALEYHLRSRHWLDALTPELEAHIAQLAATLRRLLDTPASDGVPSQPWLRTAPPPPPPPAPPPVPRPRKARLLPLLRGAWRGWWGLPRTVRRVAAGVAVVAGLYLWLKPPSGGFVIRDASVADQPVELRATVTQVRFFEGPGQLPATDQRQYDDFFAAGATRYLYVEVTLEHERAEREVRLPISCVITTADGAVFATVAATGRIQPEWKGSNWASGWGSERGGTWPAGRYTAECSYAGDPIGRGRFEMATGGSPDAPPPPAPAPARDAERLDPRIPELDGRVTALRFFPDYAGPLTPAEDREYRTSFEASDLQYLGVELEISHPAPGRSVKEQVSCDILRPDGDRLGTVTLSVRPEPTWTGVRTASSYGWAESGRWAVGRYQVLCRLNGRLIARQAVQMR